MDFGEAKPLEGTLSPTSRNHRLAFSHGLHTHDDATLEHLRQASLDAHGARQRSRLGSRLPVVRVSVHGFVCEAEMLQVELDNRMMDR